MTTETPLPVIAPWEQVTAPAQQARLEAELRQEVAGHSADFYSKARLLARRIDRDDFLFATEDAQWPFAVVHLTFSGKAEAAPWPKAELYATVAAVQTRMQTDADLY